MDIILIIVIIKTIFTSVNNVINYFDIVSCICYMYHVVYFFRTMVERENSLYQINRINIYD